MTVRLPTILYGKNVHTTRNITESLPTESASQDDTLISTCKEHMTLPSDAAVPYEDYVDDGSMTTCTNMFAENRTRKVQIYTKNCIDSDSDIDLKLPLESLGSSCIDNTVARFEAKLPSFGSGKSEMDKVNNQSYSSHKDNSDSIPEQELWISNPQQRETHDTHHSGRSTTVADVYDLDLNSIPENIEMDNTNDSGGSTCKNEHDFFYSRKNKNVCCLLLEEINEVTLNGEQIVAPVDEHDTLVSPPSPEEHGVSLTLGSSHQEEPPCELDREGKCIALGKTSQCKHSPYRNPLSIETIKDIMKPDKKDDPEGGLIWKANIVPDNYDKDFKKNGNLTMCTKNDYDAANQCIKPRRGNLLVKESDFFNSLVCFTDEDEIDDFDLFQRRVRWVFSGVLCGWPGLQLLELIKIEYKRAIPLSKYVTHWKYNKDYGKPTFPTGLAISEVRVVLRSPCYSTNGWAKDSRGYVFWFEGNETGGEPKVTFGTNIVRTFEKERIETNLNAKCVKVNMISHRFATGDSATIRDRLTYHSLALLEWDHRDYCTVVELSRLGGVGGCMGRADWVEDKLAPMNSFYKVLPAEMIHPWKSNLSEIRAFDVKAKSLEEHLVFMKRFEGKGARFLDITVTFEHEVRLSLSSKDHVAQYLINYISRQKTYSVMRRNCQTFAANFCAFLAGKKDVEPYHPINRIQYHNQTHYFLYEPSMYESHH